MSKYYFYIDGISADLKSDKEAEDTCNKIEELLNLFGYNNTNIMFSTEDDYFKDLK